MAQYRAYANPAALTSARVPYLLDVQSDLLDSLATRIVVPLVDAQHLPTAMKRLHPVFEIEGKQVVMATADLASIPARLLVRVVADLSLQRGDILAALDLLLTGI